MSDLLLTVATSNCTVQSAKNCEGDILTLVRYQDSLKAKRWQAIYINADGTVGPRVLDMGYAPTRSQLVADLYQKVGIFFDVKDNPLTCFLFDDIS